MSPAQAALSLLALVTAATLIGLLWRRGQGRVRDASAVVIRPADVSGTVSADGETVPEFGRTATLLQFSTEYCARCPGTHRLLAALADSRPGTVHLDVDLTHRADLASRFNITQTPTVLILDASGIVRGRASGMPDRAALSRHLDLVSQTTPSTAPHTR